MANTMDANSLFRVDGLVAVITGGGTGIGLTMARALVRNGAARVYLLGRRAEVLEAAAGEHANLVAQRCDVTSKEELQAAVDRVAAEVGYVNLLVANSGVLGPAMRFSPTGSVADLRRALFADAAMDAMTDVLHVNVTAAFFTMAAFLELLDAGNAHARRGGFGKPDADAQASGHGGGGVVTVTSQVIFTSSIAAFSRFHAATPPYLASKAAITQITKQASSQLARHGIRVNALAPGLFPSEIASGLIGDRKPEEEGPDDTRFIPARRFGGDEEMAGTILYLASRSGSYCNGAILVPDGGRLGVMPSSY